ncbi:MULTISPECIES: hypothetical protein [Paenibacillus]|uniref:Uncharacterized protein n=1 Tax=Paenibacillus taichungensis TaxID=484184 RepID=A0ABX2ML97_9BACL|nr:MULTISPECIES: hypothetical protein [Paenibacillus]NUU54797.1 hypothetical protein [Paenibacillus taichungensis]SLK16245.1 hypothetical protein SAMN06272722_110113 [Paenibacillus sp. RU5A]SOC74282.1 hypothetical protein SAMN05880581_110113 [Paenibacillus sp. RU26A]SOC76432.1 hypothetical protein SAMN05880586_110113 [Paenibacillus sp. RU5M]
MKELPGRSVTNSEHETSDSNNMDDALKPNTLEAELKTYLEESDILYKYVNHDSYPIVTADILKLDQSSRYATADVAEILQSYDYLKTTTGENQIDDARLRWWLNAKREDNLIDYLNIQKTGNSWTWDVYAIVRAKIVSILRYCHKYSQKDIKVMATGLSIKSSARMAPETIVSMVKSGEIHNIESFDALKNTIIAYVEYNEKRFETEITESVEFIGTEFRNLSEEHNELKERQEQLDESAKKTNEILARTLEMDLKLKEQQVKRILRLEATESWNSRGVFKNLLSSQSDKEAYIQKYIEEGMKEFAYTNQESATSREIID